MRNIKTIYVFIIFSALTLGSNANTSSYPNFQADERNKAIELFHNGKFAEALPVFKKLSDSYPSDYLLKYFTGACLIETGVYNKESEMNLLLAGTRDVPSKVFYYLARYYHAKDDWDSALRFYNRFKNNSQPGQVTELRIDELSQLAYDHINPFTEAGFKIPEKKEPLQPEANSDIPQPVFIEPPANMDIPKEVVVNPEEKPIRSEIEPKVTIPEQVYIAEPIEIPVEEPVTDTTSGIPAIEPQTVLNTPPPTVAKINFIRFQVNSQVTYLTEDLFQVAEAREAWKTGTEKEIELNGFLETLTDLRNQYQHIGNPGQRDELARRIIDLERQTLILRAETDKLFQRARQLEQQWWADADYTTYKRFSQVSDSLLRLEEALRVASLPPPPVIDDSMIPEDLDLSEEEANETPDQDELSYKVQLGSFTRAVPARTQA